VPNKKNPHIIDVSWLVNTLIVDFLAKTLIVGNCKNFNCSFYGINYGSIGPYKSRSDDIDGVHH
jgi:hypothetical protein